MDYREPITKFEDYELGKITYGPSHALVCNFVSYRRSDMSVGCYCDLRMCSYSSRKNKFCKSKKGITIPEKCIPEVINALVSLPIDPPSDIPLTGNKILVKFQKYNKTEICVSLTKEKDFPKVDIREYVNDVIHGYTGFTYRGVRINYEMAHHIVNFLERCYEMMKEFHGKGAKKKSC